MEIRLAAMKGNRRMSRRRRLETIDPMDLLLDTVSNVFGGVMFLTLLAALLVISQGEGSVPDGPKTPLPEALSPLEIATRIESLELEASELNFVMESQARTLSEIVPSDDTEQKIAQYDRLRQQLAGLQDQWDQVQTDLRNEEALQKTNNKLEKELSEQLAELSKQVQGKKTELERVEAKSSRTITFSLLRDATTADFPLLLRYGKLYRFLEWSGQEIHEEDIAILGDEKYLPKQAAGIPITPNVLSNLVSKLVDRHPPREYHITIFVWDDSFAAFNSLRNRLVEQGYQYRTLPCTDESIISMGGGDRLVQ